MIFAYCDGAIEPRNPGGWAVGGWVIKADDGAVLDTGTRDLGWHAATTNNQAEHIAVQGALAHVVELGCADEPITVRTDSQLVVNQLTKKWGCVNPVLVDLRDETLMIIERHDMRVTFEWIPRAQNTEADAMSRTLYRGHEEELKKARKQR